MRLSIFLFIYQKLQSEKEQADTMYWPLRVPEYFYGQQYWPGRSVDTTWRHGGRAPLTPGTCTFWEGTCTDAAGAPSTGDKAVKKWQKISLGETADKRFLHQFMGMAIPLLINQYKFIFRYKKFRTILIFLFKVINTRIIFSGKQKQYQIILNF